jgi:hypothetical protein
MSGGKKFSDWSIWLQRSADNALSIISGRRIVSGRILSLLRDHEKDEMPAVGTS